jgi:PKD repeat protein
MNSTRKAVPNVLPTASRRASRLPPAAILFAAAMLGAISCSDDTGTSPFTPVDLGYVDSVAPQELKREANAPEGEPVSSASLSPSASLSASSSAAGLYTVSAIPFAPEAGPFIPPAPFSNGFPGTDDLTWGGSLGFPIGFNFMFYNQTYDKFWIASNGAVLFQLDPRVDGACCGGMIPLNDPPNPQIPNSGPKNNLVALAWTDLQPLSGQVTWTVRGSAPNRRLIVNFNQVGYHLCLNCAPSAEKVSTQAILYERTNVIEVHTRLQQNPGKLVTQGVENATGTEAAFLAGRNRLRYALTNDAVRFTPAGQNALPIPVPGGNAGGPPANRYEAVEGSPILFAGSGTDADGDPLTYTWDFTSDGIPDVSTAEASYTYADNGKYLATLTVNDGRGGINQASVDVIIKNAPPAVKANSNARINAGESMGFSGEFSDAGQNDAAWEWTWNVGAEGYFFGGGLESQGAVPVVESYRFCKAGKYDVKLTVTDKDKASGSDQVEVIVDALPVQMDVSPNTINLNGNGHAMITVRIYSRQGLDATALNPDAVRLTNGYGRGTSLARTGGGLWYWDASADLNGDGLLDVSAGFRRDDLLKNGDLSLNSLELKLSTRVGECGDVAGAAPIRVKVVAKEKSAAASMQPTGEAAEPIDPSNP